MILVIMGKNPFTNQRQVLLGMHSDVETWITECGRCTRRKTPNNQRASPVNTVPSALLELVYMDYLTLKVSTGGYQHIMVITYHFTRYSMVILTRNQLARTTAEAVVFVYSIPSCFISIRDSLVVKSIVDK